MIGVAVLTMKPSDDLLLLHTAFFFADTWTGIPVGKRSLTDRAHMGGHTALNKKHKLLLEDK